MAAATPFARATRRLVSYRPLASRGISGIGLGQSAGLRLVIGADGLGIV